MMIITGSKTAQGFRMHSPSSNNLGGQKMKKYICTITSNSTAQREYEVTTTSAMKCAVELGRCEGGETVTVSRKCGTVLSRVKWTPENGGEYYRVY